MEEREVVDRDDFAGSARGEEIVWDMQDVEVEPPRLARSSTARCHATERRRKGTWVSFAFGMRVAAARGN